MGSISTILHKCQRQDGVFGWHTQACFAQRSWISNLVWRKLNGDGLLYNTAKEIWDATNLMYSNLGNDSKLYELSEKARSIQQGDLSIMAFFNSLNILYQEIDLCQDIVWKNPEDHSTYRKLIEKERVFKFLLVCGLNLIKKGVGF